MENEPIKKVLEELDNTIDRAIQEHFPTLRDRNSVYALTLKEIVKRYTNNEFTSKYDVKKALRDKYSPTSVERAFKELLEKGYIIQCGTRPRKRGEGIVKLYKPTLLGMVAAAVVGSLSYLLMANFSIFRGDEKIFDKAVKLFIKVIECRKCILSKKILHTVIAEGTVFERLVNMDILKIIDKGIEEIEQSIKYMLSIPLYTGLMKAINWLIMWIALAKIYHLREEMELGKDIDEEEYALCSTLEGFMYSKVNEIYTVIDIKKREIYTRLLEEATNYEKEIIDYLNELFEYEKERITWLEHAISFINRNGLLPKITSQTDTR